MSQKVTGLVHEVFEKQFEGKGGKPGNKWFSVKLDGDPLYYRCKSKNPGNVKGKYVEFEASNFKEKDAQVDSDIKVVERAKASPVTGGAPANAREGSIQYQSARGAAIDYVGLVILNGGVKLPAKEAAKLEALDALLDSYTAKFFQDVETFGAVARANGTDGEASTDEPKDVGEDE